jgi:hypothetical protein
MSLRFNTSILLCFLAFTGCRENTIPQPARSTTMKHGDLEIQAQLNRDGSPFSSQEDIDLKVLFQSSAPKDTLIPFMPTHPANWDLKNLGNNEEKTIPYVPQTPPGLPRTTEPPQANLPAGQKFTYSLRVQTYLGFLQPGKYSLRFRLNSRTLPFSTDWLDFSILEKDVDAFTSTQSMTGMSRCLHLAWRDRGASPPRLLLQRSYIGENKSLMPRVLVIGEGDTGSIPVPSYAPEGREPSTIWVGWRAGRDLRLARIGGDDKIISLGFPSTVQGTWEVVPFLNYTEAPGGKESMLSGSLIGKDPQGAQLSCFQFRNQKDFAWVPSYRLPPGEILAIRLVPVAPESRYFIWVRSHEGTLHAELASWDDKNGLGRPWDLGNVRAAASDFKAFDATALSGKLVWGIAFREGAPDNASRLVLWNHSFDLQAKRTSPGVPKPRHFPAKAGPFIVTLKFDSQSRPWLLHRDVHGAWVQSPDFEEPIPVETPRGSKFESLFFRKGALPRVTLFNPETGFETRIVTFPGSEKKQDEDEVEDNE